MSTRLHAEAPGSIEPLVNRGLVTGTLVLSSMIYSIDWTIAAVALPHMQGAFSATQDQISWVLTSYIVASAVMLPATGWLSAYRAQEPVLRLGRRVHAVLPVLRRRRVAARRGAAARRAGRVRRVLIPLSQAIMLDTYPVEEHGKAMALWGMGGARAGDRPDARRLSDRRAVVALDLLHQRARRRGALLGGALFLPRAAADDPRPFDLFGLRRSRARGRGHADDARPGPAPGLVRLPRDHDRSDRHGRRPVLLRRAQPDQPRARSSICA